MPIDYSKFDSIDDSDEEAQATPAAASRSLPKGGPKGGYPPAGKSGPASGRTASGRELLEPGGLEERLSIMPTGAGAGDPLAGLATEFEKLAAQAAPSRSQDGTRPQEQAQPAPAKPGEPQRVCMRSDGRKKIHTTFPDGGEMVEEFDERTDVLLLRKTRRPTKLGGEGNWTFEVGQAPEAGFDPHSDLMRTSASNPIFLRKDTPEHFQWRIRNLAYPADVYSVSVDHDKQEVVVRTSNKKYYKRIAVPDLSRCGKVLEDEKLSWKHQHNTLIISYTKPEEVVLLEQKVLREAEKSALHM
jgi:hypothetical protein